MSDRLRRVILGVENFMASVSSGLGFDRQVDGDSEVVAYRGFGTPAALQVSGRVLARPVVHDDRDQTQMRNLLNMIHRYNSKEIPGAQVTLECMGARAEVETDDEGYYSATLQPTRAAENALWQPLTARLPEMDARKNAFRGFVQVPNHAKFGIISDVDDTVVRTGATSLISHTRMVLLNSAFSRVPFAGVAPFYRALQEEAGRALNPIFYVSSSPWNLYSLFEDFLVAHGIPAGTFFLKDFGVDETKLLKTSHGGHKQGQIERVLAQFPHLSFILIGDSGQMDPEIYRDIVNAHPDRILAVYLRDVTEDARDLEIRVIATEIEGAHGVPVLAVPDTVAAARHAAENDWIDADELATIDKQALVDHAKGDTGEDLGEIPEQLDAVADQIEKIDPADVS